MSVLDYGERTQLEEKYGPLEEMFPLPGKHLTNPALVVTPHQDTVKPGTYIAAVGNWEEVETQ
jgi:hypothetical protein